MTHLRIAPDLRLPLEAITETVAILGIRGSGKTNTAAVYAEELLGAGQQVVIIDPTDSWWGLKSSADGLAPGHAVVVLGGKHQDLPLASTDGKIVADFVVEQHASIICSMRGFESKQQELRFATDFLRRLYFLKGQQESPTPLALIIDEASRLVPQRVMGEDAACVGAVQQIVRQGRSSGFGVVLIDQRAATVNKDVLAQLEMLVVHRTTSPQDRKALREWIQQHDTEDRESKFLDSLASLKVGEAWVWSPGWLNLFVRVTMRARKTFDSSRTPRAGEVVVTPKKIAEVDLNALKAKMAATLEKAKADDPRELRKRIAALETSLASDVGRSECTRKHYSDKELNEFYSGAMTRGRNEAMHDLKTILGSRIGAVDAAVNGMTGLKYLATSLVAAWDDLHRAIKVDAVPVAQVVEHRPPNPVVGGASPSGHVRNSVSMKQNRTPGAVVDGSLSRHEQKLLDAAAKFAAMNVHEPSLVQLAGLAGISISSSATDAAFARLNRDGFLVIASGGKRHLTMDGAARAAIVDTPPTLEQYHKEWQRLLGDKHERKLFDVYLAAYPYASGRAEGFSRKYLADRANISMTSSATDAAFSYLVGLGLFEKAGDGIVRGGPTMFPEGLA